MALASTDERDLILPLFSGIRQEPLWDIFLRRLLARTHAQRVSLSISDGNRERQRPLFEHVIAAPGAPRHDPLTMETSSANLLLAYNALRPNRVYSLEEMLILDDTKAAERQRAALRSAGVAHARFIRIPGAEDHTIWLFLYHDRHDFGAADSALLSAVAPYLVLAFGMLLESDALRLRAGIAEQALGLLGVGQALLDGDGRIVVTDAVASEILEAQPGSRPQLRGRYGPSLSAECQDLSGSDAAVRKIVRIDEREATDMMLRPAPAVGSPLPRGAAVALVRRPLRENEVSAARVITSTLGLSLREAALAEAIGRGRTIVEAGSVLQLTPETARNYSKRIYAKTGTSGQADLVRLLLTGLAPFA